ncbi:MAG: hypothetical protein HC830_03680 [Bacteroidetes bacterium]|nr:hypothetical protein [Bacteroidota bacterium]
MKTTKAILITLICCISFLTASGQETQEKKSKWAYKKVNENGSYVKMVSDGFQYTTFNFFTGPDVENFRTTLKGFGSIGNDFELTLITVGNRQVDAFLDLGLSLRYYRFEENLMLSKSAGSMEASIVENPPYEFKNKFFRLE